MAEGGGDVKAFLQAVASLLGPGSPILRSFVRFTLPGVRPLPTPIRGVTALLAICALSAIAAPAETATGSRARPAHNPGVAFEAPVYGLDFSTPELTDALRSSKRIGTIWWALVKPQSDPVTGAALPYAYVDGYPELIGKDRTAEEAALRWHHIMTGKGDSWVKRSGEDVGKPGIVLLDEITPKFKDDGQGPAFEAAVKRYISVHGGNRDDLFMFGVRSVSMTPSNHTYQAVIRCANNYVRFFGLELYTSHKAYLTGFEPDQPTINRGSGDEYLCRRLLTPIRRWTQAGVNPRRLHVLLTVSNFADAGSNDAKPFYKFLNRQFWMMANGWYTADRSVVDTNIQAVLRNGVGAYKFGPGTKIWQLDPNKTDRDDYFEKYVHWYCVLGNTNAHPDGVDAK